MNRHRLHEAQSPTQCPHLPLFILCNGTCLSDLVSHYPRPPFSRTITAHHLVDMPARAGRVANAPAALRQWQCFRQPGALALLPGPAISVCARRSFSSGLPKRGLMGWLRGKAELPPAEKQLVQTTTALGSAARDKANPAMVLEQPERIVNPPLRDSPHGASPPVAKSPSSKQWKSSSANSHRQQIGRLESCTSDDANIYLNFERPNLKSEPRPVRMSKLYLRDACQCGTCVSKTTGMKAFATCDIPMVPQLVESETGGIKVSEDGDLEITWADDFLTKGNHVSVYPTDLLRRLVVQNGRIQLYYDPPRTLWDSAAYRAHMDSDSVNYIEFMVDGPEFGQAVFNILKYGLVFIQDVPESNKAVRNIASRLGSMQSTFLPAVWNACSDTSKFPGPVGHSNEIPCLHQDLVFWRDRPKLQILHCLHNDRQGGESLFSDGARAAWELKHNDPLGYMMLARHIVTFHYHSKKHYFVAQRPVITTVRDSSRPLEVSWSPPFQGPFRVNEHWKPAYERYPLSSSLIAQEDPGPTALEAWHEAARAFKASLEAPENVLRHRLQPGECVIVDNRRILNGRTEYDTGPGYRYLRGAFVDKQSLSNTLINLYGRGLLRQEHGDVTQEAEQAGVFDQIPRNSRNKSVMRMGPGVGLYPWRSS